MNDEKLITLAERAREARSSLADLLAGDSRDASDIPGFAGLADCHLAALQALAGIGATNAQELLAKAKAVDLRDAAMRSDGAVAVALSLAVDVVAVLERDEGDRCRISSTEIAT